MQALHASQNSGVNPEIYYNIGLIYMAQERHNDAIEYFSEATRRKPDYLDAYLNLGAVSLKKEDHANAIKYYQAALTLKPEDSEISYILSALQQGITPEQAPREYLQHLFDQYAPYFDKHLQEYLDYRVPQLLYDAVTQELGTLAGEFIILDLGCGTGLCGAKFRPLAKHLIGIDISAKMIDTAAQKKIYDELKVLDVTQALQDFSNIDIILAADVFTYIGNLAAIFAHSKQTLKAGGFLHSQPRKPANIPMYWIKRPDSPIIKNTLKS